jgi:hypothetical protein
MKTSFTFHQDPGHGWVAVDQRSLRELGMSFVDFSGYSYISKSGNTIYLEEDCDASKFVAAYNARFGNRPALLEKHRNNRHWIRSLHPNYWARS